MSLNKPINQTQTLKKSKEKKEKNQKLLQSHPTTTFKGIRNPSKRAENETSDPSDPSDPSIHREQGKRDEVGEILGEEGGRADDQETEQEAGNNQAAR